VLSQVKLIAEPWDLGEGGYQVGNFPVGWAEWNGKYRDTIRRYWKGDGGQVAELAYRLSGSSDLYEMSGRRPFASINFITAHDGFSLHDLVSYNDKHNEANGENNQDGTNDNLSWNCGVEGPTDDQAVNDLRMKQKRNMLATLLLSQGVPMLCGGDEISRSQQGNNNAYCQDNEISWHNWHISKADRSLHTFVRQLIALRQAHPVFRRRRFFQGRQIHGSEIKDIMWLHSDGKEMDEADWGQGHLRAIGLVLAGDAIEEKNTRGNAIVDDTFLLLLNAHHEAIQFVMPQHDDSMLWHLILDTAISQPRYANPSIKGGENYEIQGRSLVVFRRESIAGLYVP
jgi:glycogen operon protein